MATALYDQARDIARDQRPARSRLARSMFADLMALDPEVRRGFFRAETATSQEQILRIAQHEAGTPLAIYVDDPVGFVTDVLDETLWSKSREVLASVAEHQTTAVPSCFGSSKCVYYADSMQLADGSLVRAEDLVGREFKVLGWAEDGTQTVRRAWAAWNAIEPVYRLTTSSGRQVTRNGHHPLWAADNVRRVRSGGAVGTVIRTPENAGWRGVADLSPGDLVLVPERVDVQTVERLPHEQAALLGYLLGDGSTLREVRFSHLAGESLDEFVACVERLGSVVKDYASKGRHRELVVRGPQGLAAGGRRGGNPVLTLVQQWGLFGRKATDKSFPELVWQLHRDDLAVILGRLFACDGYASSGTGTKRPGTAIVAIGLANEGMVRDIQRLMLRFGIAGKVSAHTATADGKRYPFWRWSITDAASLRRFADTIDVPGKRAAFEAAATTAEGRRHREMWPHRNAPEGYRWEKVAAVERLAGDEQTVAITVETDHTWVDLLVEHNTWGAARIGLWWSMVHAPGTALAVTMAPLWRQVVRQMWPEIRRAHARAHLQGQVDTFQMKMQAAETGLWVTTAYGLVANRHDESATQGIHSPHLLVVVDEAGGIPANVGQNLRAIMTGDDSRLLAIGNPPTDDEGSWFEQLCTERDEDDDDVNVIRISAYDTPALTEEQAPRCKSCPAGITPHTMAKHLVTKKWVDDTIREFGVESPYVQSKVYARFPRGGSDRALPYAWVELARDVLEPDTDDEDYVSFAELGIPGEENPAARVRRGSWVRLGVDVAADGGDEMVVSRAAGDLVGIMHRSSGPDNADAVKVAGKILTEIRRATVLAKAIESLRPVRVKIDAIGVGWGVAGLLEAWGSEGIHEAEIVKVVVSEGIDREPDPMATLRPRLKRDELWLGFRELLPRPGELDEGVDPKIRLRVDRKTVAQLTAPEVYTDSQGRAKVEGKASLRKRGMSSPDRAESVLLSVYEPAPSKPKRRKAKLLVN